MHQNDGGEQTGRITPPARQLSPPHSIDTFPDVLISITHIHVARFTNYLALFYRCSVFITHGTDLHPALSLLVSLPEELLHDSLRPLSIHGQGFGGIAQVGTVHQVSQNLHKHAVLLSLKLRKALLLNSNLWLPQDD